MQNKITVHDIKFIGSSVEGLGITINIINLGITINKEFDWFYTVDELHCTLYIVYVLLWATKASDWSRNWLIKCMNGGVVGSPWLGLGGICIWTCLRLAHQTCWVWSRSGLRALNIMLVLSFLLQVWQDINPSSRKQPYHCCNACNEAK